MNSKIILVLAVMSALMLSACEKPAFIQEYLGPGEGANDFTVLPPGEGIDVTIPDNAAKDTTTNMTNASEDTMSEDTSKEDKTETKEETTVDTSKYVKKIVKEGDTVKLTPEAVDPDGDVISYTFSEPLDENGVWETEKGDAGQYLVEVTASDGRLQTTQKILIVVESVNDAPEITGLEDLTVEEGDAVKLDFEVSDPDGDEVTIDISGWMDDTTYETDYTDAGEYEVTVTASDGTDETSETITVTVLNVNRAPVIEQLDTVDAVEEDEIKLDPKVSDPDGDEVEVTFSEPFDEKGLWQTEVGDAGEYTVTITASDGEGTTESKVTVVVATLNQPPVIEELDDIEVSEGDTVVIEPVVSDPDGDEVEITYSGWMTSSTYETGYDDAGEHEVTVTASDGKASVSRDVTVTVLNSNRPPEFVLVG